MLDFMRNFDELTRRHWMERAAKTMLGVSILPTSLTWAKDEKKDVKKSAPSAAASGLAAAKNVIFLCMSGGMTHLDTFDLKPGREVQGETKGIQTKTVGLQIGSLLPELAKLSDHLAIVRSLHTETGDHDQGRYLLRTAYKEIATIRHPGMGAWIMKLKGQRTNRTLPDNVLVNGEARHPGAGYLEPSFTPVPIADPNQGLQNTKEPEYVSDSSFDKRMKLIDSFDSNFRKRFPQKQVDAYSEFYRQATALMSSADLKAFDLSQEKNDVRDKYGRDRFGQGCLLARRLIEHDVRFIEVCLDGWDQHVDIFDAQRLPARAGILDKALATLIQDLSQKGLLKTTLIALGTEFGRSPKINQNGGRDHHPGVFSGLFAGGGIKGGRAWGTSDKDAFSPDKDPVSISDFNATIAHAMGLPLNQEIISKSGRPFKVSNGGSPLTKLFT